MGKGTKIYSRRFPKKNMDDFLRERGISPETIPEPSISYEQFCKLYEENSEYVIIPQKAKRRQRFIDIAMELSSVYEIDMDIVVYPYYVQVEIYANDATYTRHLKSLYAELAVMSDCITHFTSLKGKEFDFTIILDYHTHTHYLSGREVDFM